VSAASFSGGALVPLVAFVVAPAASQILIAVSALVGHLAGAIGV
jgi:VIT1/CCC1 family predicted Fe2+/Mn2+ transporter